MNTSPKKIKYDSVIFDLDGTLLDTLADLHAAVNHSLKTFSLPERTVSEVRRFVGNGIRLLIERSVPEGTPAALCDKVFDEFKSYYAKNCENETKPYFGIPELMLMLKERGVPCAIVSNKADFAVKTLTDKFFPGLCAAAIGEREGIRKKPAPDSVFEAMRLIGSEKPVYVGDSEVDVATARAANIPCISVCWGFRSRDELIYAGAENICENTEQLIKTLEDK